MNTRKTKYWSMVALTALGLLAVPGVARADTLTDWYNWSGTQSLDHDRTVTRYIAIGYGNPATLNHTAGTLYHGNTAGDGFIIGNNVAGTYNMSGNAAVNAADGTGRLRLGNEGGHGTMTMTDNATATVGSLQFGGHEADTLLLSGNAAVNATDLAISTVGDYISFASGCAATLTVTGKVLADYQAWVSGGQICVDGVKQVNFNSFRVVGNTLSLMQPPTKLAFGVQPSNLASGSAGLPITPAVTVLIQDAAGNTVTTATSSVTISSGTTAFTPGSVLTVNAVDGVATFAAIAPTTNGTHTLTASSGSLTPATSSPFLVGPETLTDWYNWSGTQSLDHDRTVTRYIAIGYGNPATLNHTAGTLYHSYTGDWFVIGNNVTGTYNMSGNAAVNAADGTGRFRLGNSGGQATVTMTDNATATVGPLEFGGIGADTLLLSGSASMHATGLAISGIADYISFASGCAATLTVTGKVLADYQAWVSAGYIRVDGVKQANFNNFKVVGNTLSLMPPPTKLAFGVQPSNLASASAGLPITPAVTVLLQDADGNTVTNATNSVTISSGTTAFTPGSVLTVNAVNGVATFAAITPTTTGTHTLTASSGSLTPATSNPFEVGPETLIDWYDWSGTQSLDHDRTVTRYIAIGYNNPATLNHTAGTLYHSYTGDWFVIGNNVAGTYNMSGNAAVNAADGAERFRLGNAWGGQATMTMTDNATATVGPLEFGGVGSDTLLLSGNASMHATSLAISGADDYISFASGCAATLTVTGKVLADYQAWVSGGQIRVDGVKQANFNSFKVVGNTLSLMPPPTKLAFGVQPSNPGAGSAGLPITPAVTVMLQDSAGNTVNYATNSVTITSGTTAFTPGSVLTVNAVNGVATFTAIAPTTNGTHTLTASSGSLTPATSNPFQVGPDTLIDWYDWSGTQSLNHDRTVTRYIAIGYNNPATLNHTAGTLYHSYTGDWFVIGNNVPGTYHMSGNAAVNAADGTERFRLGNESGQGTMTMTDNTTATVGSLEFDGFGTDTLLLSGNAAVNAAGLAISTFGDYISFASGCTATLTVTGKVLSDYQAWVSTGHIRVDGVTQANFGKFKVTGNTLSLATGAVNNYSGWLAANPEAAGQAADQDHDNDGVPNGVECFLGGTTNTTGFTHLPGVVNTAGTRSVTWTKGSGYTGAYGTDYVVEVSDTLQNWANANLDHVTESPASVKYTFPVGTLKFARLKVVVP